MAMNAISRSTKSLLEPGDLNLFPREGDKQAKRSLSRDNEKENIGREFWLAQFRGRVNELRWQDKHGVVVTDAVWLAVKCNRHRKIVLITRQEASFLIHSLRP